jgi:hypothetical protein
MGEINEKENGSLTQFLRKWRNCVHSKVIAKENEVPLLALLEKESVLSFACTSRNITTSFFGETMYLNDEEEAKVAILAGAGTIDSPRVLKLLRYHCGNCSYHKPKM